MWENLELGFQAAFEAAWEAYCNGSIPRIGIVSDRFAHLL